MTTTVAQMRALIDDHIAAEIRGDVASGVATYAEDVVHDVVGLPTGPVQGIPAASGFYEYLAANVRTEEMVETKALFGDDFCVMEHDVTASVPGNFLGVDGHGKQITFRLLHVWEFRDGLMTRENVWMDGGAVIAQLTAGEAAAAGMASA